MSAVATATAAIAACPARTPAHVNLLKPVDIPEQLVAGEKFVKWDEDSVCGTPVTLRVDPHGFYLYWIDQNQEVDMLDFAVIRDARTGRHAKVPKDPKLRSVVALGSQDTLEDKTVTVSSGSDFVNITLINFCCTRKEIAQMWTEEIVKLAYNINQMNLSTTMHLQKAHTKLTLTVDKNDKIPVKSIIKMFANSKDDRKRVEKALESANLPSGKNDAISLQKFTFEDFFTFYKNLTSRVEVEKVFDELCGTTAKRKYMTPERFVEFLNQSQRDPRLNEILHPYANIARAKDLIHVYEPSKANAQKGHLSLDGFLRYLMSDDNPIMAASSFDLSDDMDQPLSHYFINSSHNTYLTGHQLTGKSSVEIYRQCLLAGCRCVELDFWNGPKEEPVIVHGYTFVPEINAKEVIEAISESAFKTSDFPVILSFENHCNPRQQAKIAQYCREIFGEMLLDAPLDSHPLEPGQALPSPGMLRRKIIIKNKKKHHHHHKKPHDTPRPNAAENAMELTGNGDIAHAPPLQARQGSKESQNEDDENDDEEDSTSGEEDEDTEELKELKLRGGIPEKSADKGSAKETEAGAEISALVNYIQPVHFISFENAKKKKRLYEMSSFDEKQATTLLKERPIEFVNYNKYQLSRVYPAGTRFDSSNFMPQVFWNAGCQLVALNYQTLDLAMQLNLGIFEYNARCGYLLKPEFMRRQDRRFDPFAESIMDGIIAGTVSIHVLSGQFLSDKRIGTYVEVDMYGLPADTVRRKFRTKIVPNNAINPQYNEEPFVFKKVVLPELASIRIAAYEDSGKLIGHRVLPVIGLCPGYRHVALRTEAGQPLPLATLFLHLIVKDYVPDGLSDFAEALANPIKYQSELEKRAQQLSVLTDDNDVVDVDAAGTAEVDGISNPSSNQGASVVAKIAPKKHNPSSVSTDLGVSSMPATTAIPALANHRASVVLPALDLSTGTDSVRVEVDTEFLADSSQSSTLPKGSSSTSPALYEVLTAETLDKIMELKSIKEKKQEMDRKLESLRKKQEKERLRLTSESSDPKSRAKYYTSKLVKRLSSKNMDTIVSSSLTLDSSDYSEEEQQARGSSTSSSTTNTHLPRSQSERLLSVCREHMTQEREIREKYTEAIYSAAEKHMRSSQQQQLKILRVLQERETAEVMRRLQEKRREEVKALAKVHRDKDEMVRIKREVDSSMVEKGVRERERLTKLYDMRRTDLERQHDAVRHALEEERAKCRLSIQRDFDTRCARVEEETSPQIAAEL